jgi:CheY-like chemotaxis protein/two-component sensor histidine kinase
MLLDRTDGTLTAEQERQVGFIRKAADTLAELVDDLLDLAKVEAGKIEVHAAEFEVATLFGALRGMLRPMLVNESVALVFEDPDDLPLLYTDEGKVSQILRNFISNALKFTERGEVRVTARLSEERDAVAFSVADTGIGIASEDRERIFHEFTQIDSPLQRRVKGTGLGLPLCRKLAELLGGAVAVESTPGLGSTFTAVIPLRYDGGPRALPAWHLDPGRRPVLVLEDSPELVMLYEKYLQATDFQVLAARTLREAREAISQVRPCAIILDILLRGEHAWELLAELKRREDTREIPVLVISTVDDERKGLALGADAYCVKPIDRQRLLSLLAQLAVPAGATRVLLVDDEEVSRHVLRQHLPPPQHAVSEAASGGEAVQRARLEHPDVICLDLLMPDLDGFRVLEQLRNDPATSRIPVVVVTSKHLEPADRDRLRRLGSSVLAKGAVSRDSVLSALREASALVGGEAPP